MAQYTFLDAEGYTKGLTQFWNNVKSYYSKTSSTNPTVYYTHKSDILATSRTFSIASDDNVVTATEVEFNGSDNVVLNTTIDDAKSATDTSASKHGLMSAADKYKFDKLKKINYITEDIIENDDHYSRIAKLKFNEITGTLSILLPYYALKTDLNKVFKFKGVVETLADLKAIANPEIGDVYHVSENHYDYVWAEGNPDSSEEEDRKDHWESLGPNQDMENYYTKSETDELLLEERTARLEEDKALNTRVDDEITDRVEAITDLNRTLTDNLNREIVNRENANKVIKSLIDKEITDRGVAIKNLNDTIVKALAKETDTRINADNQLQSNIDTEAETRIEQDTKLNERLDNEISDREKAISDLTVATNKALDAEAETRINADNILQSNIDTLSKELKQSDSEILKSLSEEATARSNTDVQLSKELATETDNRISVDNILQDEITTEEESRKQDVEALTAALNTEITNRQNADKDLDTKKANKLASASGNILRADTNGDLADTGITDANLFRIDNGKIVDNNPSFVTGGQVYTVISELSTDTSASVETLTTALKLESESRKSADEDLNKKINQEILDRQEVINALDVDNTSSENDGQFVFDVSETDGKISVTRKSLDEDLTELGIIDTKLPPTSKAVKTYVDATETTYKFTDGIDGKFIVTSYISNKAIDSIEVNTGAINKIESADVISTDDNSVTLAIDNRKITIDFERFIAKIDNTSIKNLVETGSYA